MSIHLQVDSVTGRTLNILKGKDTALRKITDNKIFDVLHWEKGLYTTCEQRMSRWAWRPVQSDLDILCLLTYTMVPISIHSVRGQQGLDQPAQMHADQGFHCPHIASGPFHTLRIICLFVLRFYGPVNPMGSCQAWSIYLTTLLLDRLSPLMG